MKSNNFGKIFDQDVNIICITNDKRGLLTMASTPNPTEMGYTTRSPIKIEFKIRVNGSYPWNIGCHKQGVIKTNKVKIMN